MGDGIFPSVVNGRRVGDIRAVVFQPVGYGAVVVFHLSRHDSHIASVIYYVVPVVFENLLRLHVAVEAVDGVRAAFLP